MTKTPPPTRAAGPLDSDSLLDTIVLYQRQITIGMVLAAAAVGGGWLWKRSSEIREERAGEAYISAEAAFTSGNSPLAQTEFEKLVARFPGTAAGTQSAMMLAQLLYGQSKYDEGIAVLETALRKGPKPMHSGLHALIAGGHEGAGRPVEAAAAYGRAAAATPFDGERDQQRMEQARALASANDRAGAEAIYREIGDREDSNSAAEARLRLGELLARQ